MRLLPAAAGLLACALSYGLGRVVLRPAGDNASAAPLTVSQTTADGIHVPENTSRAPAADWDTLRRSEPTLENRWRALTLFECWAQQDPAAAVISLAALREGECTLYPEPRAALRQFLTVWAGLDPDKAWAAALTYRKTDPALLEAVAAALARSRPDLVLAADVSDATRLLATAFLAESTADLASLQNNNPALMLHWLMSRPLTKSSLETFSALLSSGEAEPGDPFSDNNSNANSSSMARRLIDSSRADVIAALAGADSSAFSDSLISQIIDTCSAENAEETLTFLAGKFPGNDRAEAADPFGGGIETHASDFSSATLTWKSSDLLDALAAPLTSDSERSGARQNLQQACVREMLARDPAALIPWAQRLGRDDATRWIQSEPWYVNAPVTPELAASGRVLLENAPPGLKPKLLAVLLPSLLEYDLGFVASLLDQRTHPGQDAGEDGRLLETTNTLLTRWLPQDPAAATAWLTAQTGLSAYSPVKEWAGDDPQACSQWLDTLPAGSRKDEAIWGLVDAIAIFDPDSALTWAAQVSSIPDREALLSEVRESRPGPKDNTATTGKPNLPTP